MSFKRYSSIDNSYRQKTLEHYAATGHTVGKWTVQEKAHGSNFQVIYDGKECKFASRSQIVEPMKFFNCVSVADAAEIFVKNLWDRLQLEDGHVLRAYGELCGGLYNHPDVGKIGNEPGIQKGVSYSPHQIFYVFDLMVDEEFLDMSVAMYMSKLACNDYEAGLDDSEPSRVVLAKLLHEGTFEECLAYPNDFQTTIPFPGLPAIDDNTCEGVVLKPEKAGRLGCGSRVLLKNKNAKWKEKASEPKTPRKQKEIPEDVALAAAEVGQYFVENRLRNVLSKMGPVTQKDFGRVMGALKGDAIEDYLKDGCELLAALDKQDRKAADKLIGKAAALLLRTHFLDIIDGGF